MLETLANLSNILIYPFTFLLMFSNGLVNFPSSQLLYAFCGYLTTIGDKSILLFALFGAFGNTAGNIALYEIVRKSGLSILEKRFILDESKKVQMKNLIERYGILYIFVGKLIPTIKVFVPPVAGIAKTKRLETYIAFFASSYLWALMFLSLGALFGTHSSVARIYGIVAIAFALLLYIFTYLKYPNLFSFVDQKNKN